MVASFVLVRDVVQPAETDIQIVADGVEFNDGVVVVHWRGDHRSTVVWDSIDSALAVHSHDGSTRIEWDR